MSASGCAYLYGHGYRLPTLKLYWSKDNRFIGSGLSASGLSNCLGTCI